MTNTEDLKRTVMAPSSTRSMTVGELLSVDLGANEDVQWIWCHHGERGSSVIGYAVVPREPIEIPEKRPIGFFLLEEKGSGSRAHSVPSLMLRIATSKRSHGG